MSLSLITLELVLRNILQNCGWPIHHKEWILISTRDHHRSPQRHPQATSTRSPRYLAYTVNSPPPTHLLCNTLHDLLCIVGVRERRIAPLLAFVPDNGFKSVCQLKWVYSITQPHSDVNYTHPHPHHTPLVNGLQHLCARN